MKVSMEESALFDPSWPLEKSSACVAHCADIAGGNG
jgi:hypothetical protein